MGLDMYLYAKQYVPQKNWTRDSEPITNPIFEAINDLLDNNLPKPDFGGMYVEQQVAYWRKANAIHGWFVRELADGVDECQDIYVSRDNLTKLRDLCVQVLANRSQATPAQERTRIIDGDTTDEMSVVNNIMADIQAEAQKRSATTIATEDDPLPPTAGFFFGSNEKDEWYYRDLEDTVDQINSILAATADGDYSFSYRASW